MMLRRTLLTGLAALVAAPAAAQDAAQPPTPTVLSGRARAEGLRQANQMLNAVDRLRGHFLQAASDGSRATGVFYIERPGKLRFEYDPPTDFLIVSDGRTVMMRDGALHTTERVALRATPLNLIVNPNINIAQHTLRVSESGPWLLITLRDRLGQIDGQLTLHFFRPTGELRSWDVHDVTGIRTRTTLSDIVRPESLDPALFALE